MVSEVAFIDYSLQSVYFFFFYQIVYPIYQDRRQHHLQRHSFVREGSDTSMIVTEPSSNTSLHSISTNANRQLSYDEYDDIEDDESVDKSLFQRHQSDNISITNSLFTAVDHLEVADRDDDIEEEEEEEEEIEDDTSSTENLRHGYLPQQNQQSYENDSINSLLKDLNVQTTVVWEGM